MKNCKLLVLFLSVCIACHATLQSGNAHFIVKNLKTEYDYQAQSSTLSAAQKTKKEDEIVAKEKSAAELKRKYFGPEGELAKMLTSRCPCAIR